MNIIWPHISVAKVFTPGIPSFSVLFCCCFAEVKECLLHSPGQPQTFDPPASTWKAGAGVFWSPSLRPGKSQIIQRKSVEKKTTFCIKNKNDEARLQSHTVVWSQGWHPQTKPPSASAGSQVTLMQPGQSAAHLIILPHTRNYEWVNSVKTGRLVTAAEGNATNNNSLRATSAWRTAVVTLCP